MRFGVGLALAVGFMAYILWLGRTISCPPVSTETIQQAAACGWDRAMIPNHRLNPVEAVVFSRAFAWVVLAIICSVVIGLGYAIRRAR
jgi:hypothetical protein